MKKVLAIISAVAIICGLAACGQADEAIILPPAEEGMAVMCKTGDLIYSNDESTSYSLGDIEQIYTFSDDTLTVKDGEEIESFQIAYDEVLLTAEGFRTQFRDVEDEIPDISSYNKLTQYDLCESTGDSPGYRLYVLDGQYWLATLYGSAVWRIVSINTY